MHPVAKIWSGVFKSESLAALAGGRRKKRILRLSRAWRRILRHTRTVPPGPVLEAGCGWGAQMIPLAYRGYRVTGIDCSFRALREGRKIIREMESEFGLAGKIEQVCGDFLDGGLSGRFALVFHRGVVEHYFQEGDRLAFLSAMFARTAGGGYVVSIVPSGIHPHRSRFKQEGLGGYNIPEIDYSPAALREEAEKCGGQEVVVYPHNIMGYLNDLPAGRLRCLCRRAVYLFFQLFPSGLLGKSFRERHAYSFICVARKEAR